MATNLLSLHLDIDANSLVTSINDSSPITPPPFVQGDVIPVQVALLQRSGSTLLTRRYTQLDDASFAVRIGLVLPHPSAPVVYAAADLTYDATLVRWTGTLSCNTTEITTLLGSASQASATLEIQVSGGGGNISTEYQGAVTVRADGLKTGAPTPVPGVVFPTAAEIAATFMSKVGGAGETLTLVSPDGTKSVILRIDNAGIFHADAIS